MQRDEVLRIVKKRMANKNLFKHVLATEAVMRGLARHLGEDEERWGLAGLMHDLDYDDTKGQPAQHSLMSADMVQEMGFDEEMADAVRAHNEYHGLPRDTLMAQALYAADPLTGLIVAAALISPQRKLEAIDAQFVLNRFHEKSFARGASREGIQACSDVGLSLEEFVELGLGAMKTISRELGL